MAFSAELGKAGFTPESISTTATVTLEKTDAGFTVTKSHLDVTAKIPGADQAKVLEIANAAKAGCPISRLLKCAISDGCENKLVRDDVQRLVKQDPTAGHRTDIDRSARIG